jgi:hypothetical protein
MSIWNDHPIKRIADDCLDRKSIIHCLKQFMLGEDLVSPVAIGIYGDWGSGKTSVMRALVHDLQETDWGKKTTLTLWFDAWKYARSENALWRALLLCVVETLADPNAGLLVRDPNCNPKRRQQLLDEFELLRRSLYRSQVITENGPLRVNWTSVLVLILSVGFRFASGGLIGKLGFGRLFDRMSGRDAERASEILERSQVTQYREQITSIEQFQRELEKIIDREISNRGLSLIIFVDDLDRCLPEDAVGVLEAIKLFLDVKGCLFVIGMDRDVVERGILDRYPPVVEADGSSRIRINPRQYLDKIIQLPFTLPPLTQKQIGGYLDSLLASRTEITHLNSCRSLIEIAAPPNPRTLKRILNVLSLLISIDTHSRPKKPSLIDKACSERASLLAKIVLIQILFDDAYAVVTTNPENLLRLEKAAHGMAGGEDMLPLLDMAPKLRAMLRATPLFADHGNDTLWELVCNAQLTANRVENSAA